MTSCVDHIMIYSIYFNNQFIQFLFHLLYLLYVSFPEKCLAIDNNID